MVNPRRPPVTGRDEDVECLEDLGGDLQVWGVLGDLN